MIARIEGQLVGRGEGYLLLDSHGITYQVQVPPLVFDALRAVSEGQDITLETVHYFALEQSRATPILLGFESTLEKDFFEKLLTVPRLGPKGALTLMTQPVSAIASAIENADHKFLQSLPGIGKQRARDMIATLQGKIEQFALAQDGGTTAGQFSDIGQDVIQILLELGYKQGDAERAASEAIKANPDAPDAETLLHEVFKR